MSRDHGADPVRDDHLFSLPIRVYWEDTDAGGVVYHAAYVCFLERARTEWLRNADVSQNELREREDVVFAVRGMELDFHAPARLDDLLTVELRVVELGRASAVFAQRIVRQVDGRLLLTAQVRIACLAATNFRPRGLPENVRSRFLEFLQP